MTTYNDPHHDQALLSRYLDGDLHKDQSTAFEKHLKTCTTCQREIQNLRKTIDWIGQLRKIEVPEDFSQKVHQRVRKHRGKRRRAMMSEYNKSKGYYTWISSLLVVVIIAVSIFLYFLGQSVLLSNTSQSTQTQAPQSIQKGTVHNPPGLRRTVPVKRRALPSKKPAPSPNKQSTLLQETAPSKR